MARRYTTAMFIGIGLVIALFFALGSLAFFVTGNSASNEAYNATSVSISATNRFVETAISATQVARQDGAFAAPSGKTTDEESDFSQEQQNPQQQPQQPQRRIVLKNAQLTITVKETLSVIDSITNTAETLGGWVVSSNSYERAASQDTKLVYGTVTIRVPADKLTTVIEEIKALAVSVDTQNIDGQDVTQQYADLSSRLKNLEAAEEQLRTIMDSTTKTEDVLAVYRELVRVRGEIEQIKGQLQYYDEASSFSSIAITINPYQETRPIEIAGWSPGNSVNRAIETLANLLQGLADLVIWLIIVVLPFAIPVVLLTLIYRRFARNRPAAAPPASSTDV